MCSDSSLFIDSKKIIGQENLPVMTYLEAILPADAFLFLLMLVKTSL